MTDKQPLSEVFKGLYNTLDKFAEEKSKLAGTTCRKGCSHCCYLLALVTPTEAINMAEYILTSKEWLKLLADLLEALRAAALASDYKGITRMSYFEKGVKCPFLISNECSLYSHRPSPCRYHYVISPPENCSREATRDTQTKMINFIPLEQEIWKLDDHVMKSPIPVAAPLSLTVLWAMKHLIDRSDLSSEFAQKLKGAVDETCEGIKTPTEWTIAHHTSLLEDHKPYFEQVLNLKDK